MEAMCFLRRAAIQRSRQRPTTDLSTALVARATAWQGLKPIDPDLTNVHIPTYAAQFPHLPGFFFAVQQPVALESELLFERLLKSCARRRGWDVHVIATAGSDQMDILMAESLAELPNCCTYNADAVYDDDGAVTYLEWFNSAARVLLNGDCEDMSRMICTLAGSLRKGTFKSELVLAAQKSLRRYIVVDMFADVALAVDPSNQKYAAGRF